MRCVISLFILFWVIIPSQADVKIKSEHRVVNKPSGTCFWSCCHTLGNHYGIEALKGLDDWYDSQGDGSARYSQVEEVLTLRGISRETTYYEAKNLAFIKKHTDSGRGVIISVTNWPYTARGPANATHAVIVVDVDGEYVWLVDPNDSTKQYSYGWKHSVFMTNWTGWAVAIIP